MQLNNNLSKSRMAALLGLALVASAVHAETYAVCVGINDYPEKAQVTGVQGDPDLKGAVNDATAMRDILTGKFGVKSTNVQLLTDQAASSKGFLAALTKVLDTVKPGDQFVFTFSGHGGQVEDKSEPDGKEEVIVLADDIVVPGDLFNELAKMFTLNGVNCTFIFDSCFSGGMSRDVDGKISTRTKSLGTLKPKSAARTADVFSKSKNKGWLLKPKSQEPTATSAFLFAGKEDKPTLDISGIPDVPAHGLFTMLLVDCLNYDSKMAIKDIYIEMNLFLDELNKKMAAEGVDKKFDQSPTFESVADRAAKPILLG